MVARIIIIVLILGAGTSLGYYSLVVNDSLFTRFLFFLFCTAVVCLIVIKGIGFILPDEDYNETEKLEDKN